MKKKIGSENIKSPKDNDKSKSKSFLNKPIKPRKNSRFIEKIVFYVIVYPSIVFGGLLIFLLLFGVVGAKTGFIPMEKMVKSLADYFIETPDLTQQTQIDIGGQTTCTKPDGTVFITTANCEDFNWNSKSELPASKPAPKKNITPVEQDPPVHCEIDPKCGGGTKPLKKSECEKITCCYSEETYKLVDKSQCNTSKTFQQPPLPTAKPSEQNQQKADNLFPCVIDDKTYSLPIAMCLSMQNDAFLRNLEANNKKLDEAYQNYNNALKEATDFTPQPIPAPNVPVYKTVCDKATGINSQNCYQVCISGCN